MSIVNVCRHLPPSLMLGIAITLSACGSNEAPTIPVSGTIIYPDGSAIPDGATTQITMFEQNGEGDQRIVAERSLHDTAKKPVRFNLDIARNLVEPERFYNLRAETRGIEGDVLWQSADPLVFKAGNGEALKLALQPPSDDANLSFEKYRCGDSFHLSAAVTDERAIVRLGNRRLTLQPTATAGQFRDRHDNQLVVQDKGVKLRVDGREHAACERVAHQTPGTAEIDQTATSSNPATNSESSENDVEPAEASQNSAG